MPRELLQQTRATVALSALPCPSPGISRARRTRGRLARRRTRTRGRLSPHSQCVRQRLPRTQSRGRNSFAEALVTVGADMQADRECQSAPSGALKAECAEANPNCATSRCSRSWVALAERIIERRRRRSRLKKPMAILDPGASGALRETSGPDTGKVQSRTSKRWPVDQPAVGGCNMRFTCNDASEHLCESLMPSWNSH